MFAMMIIALLSALVHMYLAVKTMKRPLVSTVFATLALASYTAAWFGMGFPVPFLTPKIIMWAILSILLGFIVALAHDELRS